MIKHSARFKAEIAKRKNIIDMGITFTAMMRLFTKGSKLRIADQLYVMTATLQNISTAAEYEHLHRRFSMHLCDELRTAEKKLRNGGVKVAGRASFGQSAKILDLVMKVYVHYCGLPSPEIASKLVPWLHAAVDTPILRHLVQRDATKSIKAKTIEEVDQATYARLQSMIATEIKKEFGGMILPVEYDDIMWSRLNR